MNIVHLFCYPGDGGAEKYALYLTGEAKKSGNEVAFILGEDGPLAVSLKTRNLKFEIISMSSWFSLKSALMLKKYFTEKNVEIVHTHFLREHFLSVFAKILGADVKIIRTFHRLDQLPLRVGIFYKIVQNKTDGFIAVSDYLKNQMVKFGIKNEKIETIYNGVPEVKVNSHEKAIGFLGRLVEEKGIFNLAKDYDGKYNFIIAGGGPESEKIKNLNNKKIKLLGNVESIEDFFSKITILVHPSKEESTIPLSILESLSSGVPVIAFKKQPLVSLIDSNFGLLVEENNYIKMLKVAESLLNNQEKIDTMSKFAKKEYKNKYTVQIMWKKTESLYKKVLG